MSGRGLKIPHKGLLASKPKGYFDESSDDDTTAPPKRKLIKLDEPPAGSSSRDGPPLRRRGDSDDEAQDAFSKLTSKGSSGGDKKTASIPVNVKDREEKEEEDDPLEAFMADIDTQVKQEAAKPSEQKIQGDVFEEEDNVESYMNHMKKKGILVGTAPQRSRDEDVDSDEDVYATARAIDDAAEADQYDHYENRNDPTAKKEILPLPRMDHSTVEYPEIEKCFYEEHDDIAKLDANQVRQIRNDLDMRVSGVNVAKPCISFAHFGFEEDLMDTIRKAGYSEPSGIQRQGIPVALTGRDIIGIAKTGSGKTAAFLLPMIVHIMDQDELERGDGPIGVILAPTRELADQIYSEAKRFAKAYGLRVAVVYGGASKQDQFKTLRAGVEIVVATPGRLIDMIKIKATNFKRTSFLVLDEADRVFDLGFEPQVRSICDNIRPDRQTLLFSATFQKRVERLAREVMLDPVRITIGNVGQINTDVTQVIEILEDDAVKWRWLTGHLKEFEALGSVIIFVSKKSGVVELTQSLKDVGVTCDCLHGDMQQQERDKAVRDYKAKVFPTLIATDVAARGLDIKSIRTVVNYDVARDIDSHVHRVGRTGRAGEKGTAYTLITEKDDRFAGDLVRNLEEFGQPVLPEVMKIAMQNARFRKTRQQLNGRNGRGGRGQSGDRGGRGHRGRRGGLGSNSGGRGGGHSYRDSPQGAFGSSPSSSSNNIPLGKNHGGEGEQGSGYRISGFQKASRAETGALDSSGHEGQQPLSASPQRQYMGQHVNASPGRSDQPRSEEQRPNRPPHPSLHGTKHRPSQGMYSQPHSNHGHQKYHEHHQQQHQVYAQQQQRQQQPQHRYQGTTPQQYQQQSHEFPLRQQPPPPPHFIPGLQGGMPPRPPMSFPYSDGMPRPPPPPNFHDGRSMPSGPPPPGFPYPPRPPMHHHQPPSDMPRHPPTPDRKRRWDH